MKSRSELLPIYSNFAKIVETQFSKRIKIVRSSNALEYTQNAFQALLHSYGTIHHLTYPSTSQQNGRAERKLCHILDTVRTPFLFAKVPNPFWVLFMLFMLLIAFQALSSILHMSAFLGHPPDYHHLRSFNSACLVLLQPHEKKKLEPRSRLCCFLFGSPL